MAPPPFLPSSSSSFFLADIVDYDVGLHTSDSSATLKYIGDMLMEEDEEEKNRVLQNYVALQATEKPFYEAIGQKYPYTSENICNGRFPCQSDYSYVTSDEEDGYPSPNRQIHLRDDNDLEKERSNKQQATALTECEFLTEMFDSVLLPASGKTAPVMSSCSSSWNIFSKEKNTRISRGRRQGNKVKVVDLLTMLSQCAKAVANCDQRTANELLKQIKNHSSIRGDVNQRLAHYFSFALETRSLGLKPPPYDYHPSHLRVVDMLKAYHVYVKACPFHRVSYMFVNHTILKLSERAKKLHIIDFGIMYGFQWPSLIQRLSERDGGPPRLKITGIEHPQAGFPSQIVEETLVRLKKYCDRFHVEFQWHVIAKKWETIQYEDLKLDSDEMTVVNSMYRMKSVTDDTVDPSSPRDRVLSLINKMRPDFIILGVSNGAYNAPFFATRFREALFFFSTIFDMLEGTIERESEERLILEELMGRDIINSIACEGAERVERPETYKQWHSRILRSSFTQVSLDGGLVGRMKQRIRLEYDRHYVVDEDGHWLLHGWKGRIIKAISLWRPL